jgi:PPOX class probable F420-dependent enzyme
MSDDEIREFLSSGQRTAKVATVQADGRPHVAPVWFVLDGGDPVFITGANTVKGRALRRDPRLCLSVDLQKPPYAFVMIEGVAELHDDMTAALPISIAIAARYTGADNAEAFGRRNAVPGELLVHVRPTKIIALDDITG